MFWPSMVVFALLAITPFVVATVMNRHGGDALGDEEHLEPADPDHSGSSAADGA